MILWSLTSKRDCAGGNRLWFSQQVWQNKLQHSKHLHRAKLTSHLQQSTVIRLVCRNPNKCTRIKLGFTTPKPGQPISARRLHTDFELSTTLSTLRYSYRQKKRRHSRVDLCTLPPRRHNTLFEQLINCWNRYRRIGIISDHTNMVL